MKRIIVFCCVIVALSCGSCGCIKERLEKKPFVAQIKVSETDCFRCFGGTHFIQELSEVANVELVFRDMGEKEIQRFLDINGLGRRNGKLNYTVLSDSNLYNAIDNMDATEAHLFDNEGNELYAFPLKAELTEGKIAEIKSLGYDLMQKERPKLDLQFNSSYTGLSVGKSFYLVSNMTMNCCEIFDKKGNALFFIDALQINPIEIYPEMQAYEKYVNYLKNTGMFSCRIENAKMIGDEVWVKTFVPYVDVRNDSIIQSVKPCVITYYENAGEWLYNVLYDYIDFPVDAIGNAKDGVNYYGISQIYVVEEGDEYKSFAMKPVEGKLEVKQTKKMYIPNVDRIPNFAYELKVKDGLFSLNYTDFLYDLERDTVYMLPIRCNPQMTNEGTKDFKVSMEGNVLDWAFDGTALSVVYFDAKLGQCQYLYKDDLSKEFTIKVLSFGSELKCPPLCLLSPHVLYYLDSNNEVQVMIL